MNLKIMKWFYSKVKIFGKKEKKLIWAEGQVFMKHWVFHYFGGIMPWEMCKDSEIISRFDKILNITKLNKIYYLKEEYINLI